MATYTELRLISADATFIDRVQVACIVAAETIRLEVLTTPSHDARLAWAKNVLLAPPTEAKRMLWAVLAQNRAATLAQITGATDTALQTAVDAAVNLFAV
jgi:hypothetical protein